MDILFLIFILVIIFLIIPKPKIEIENYQSFKKVVVNVSPHIYNLQKILISSGDEKLFTFLQSIIPFNYNIVNDQYNILNMLDKGNIGLINDWTIFNFIYKNGILDNKKLKDNLRYICSIKQQYFYLLVKTTSNIYSINGLKNKKIGMYSKRPDYILFFEEIGYTDKTIQFIDYKYGDEKSLTDFNDGSIDAFFFIGDYPDINLSRFKDYRIIDMTDINIDNPAISLEKIDFYKYRLIGDYRIVNLCTTKASLYSLKSISTDFTYQFIKSMFSNIQKINSISLIKTGGYRPNLSGQYNMGYTELGKTINNVKFILYTNKPMDTIKNRNIGIFDIEKYHMAIINDNNYTIYNTIDNIDIVEGFIFENKKIDIDNLFVEAIDCKQLIKKYRKDKINIGKEIESLITNKDYMRCLIATNMNNLTSIEIYTRIIHDMENGIIDGFFISTIDDNKIDTLFKKYKKRQIEIDIPEDPINIPQTIIPSNILPSEYNITIHDGTKKYLDEIGYITENPNKKCMHFIGTGKCPLSYNE